MIPCPNCDQHIKPPVLPGSFDCPMCGEQVDLVKLAEPEAPSSGTKKIAVGVGVAVVVAVGGYLVYDNFIKAPPKFEEDAKYIQTAVYGSIE